MWLTNLRGLRSKKGLLEARIHNAPSNSRPDIILITESKLLSSVSDDDPAITMNGYSLMRKDRRDNSGWGGCLLYHKNGLPVVREHHLEPKSLELMIFTIQTKSGPLLLSLTYCPPKKAVAVIDWYDKHISNLISKTKANICVLAGDFNCHHREWLDSVSPTDEEGRAAFDFCCTHDLTQIVSGPTHQLGNRLDLIITDSPNLFSPVNIDHGIGTSDHFLAQTTLETTPLFEPTPPRQVWIYKKADWSGLRQHLAATPWNDLLIRNDPEGSCENVTNAICDAMLLYIPQKQTSSFTNFPEWWNESCGYALKRKDRAWRRWKALGTPEARLAYNKARNEYTSASRKAIAAHKVRVREKMTTELETGSKSWWWTARRLMGKGGKSEIPVLKSDHSTFISTEDKAECFSTFFSEKSTIPREENEKPIPYIPPRTSAQYDKVVFWPKKVKKQLLKLDVNKATGPDKIPAIVLRKAAPELATPLARLYQICFDRGLFPAAWKVADVIPCHKKGDKHSPSNYRPISLLSIISKVMERLIYEAMWHHIDTHQLISNRQFGFRAGHSTSDALTYVTQSLTNSMNNREEARMTCLDISKAFDRVWHPGLLAKLCALGFSGKLLKWLKDYLQDRSLRVLLNGRTSGRKTINAGVPQGSILGPLLFIVFIDDISDNLENPSILYADDATILSFIKSREDRVSVAASLNRDLDRIADWATSWNVQFGAAKCKTATISNRRDAVGTHPSLQFFGTTLEEVEDIELLGISINRNLSWSSVINKMVSSASQRLGLLRRASPYLDTSQKAMIYKSMVRSVMEYSSCAWMGATPTSLSQLDAVQKRAMRIIGITTDDLNSNSTNIQPLCHRRAVGALSLFHRMYHGNAPDLLCELLPEPHVIDPRLRRSVRTHHLAVAVPGSNLVGHRRSFLPYTSSLWNSLPVQVASIENFQSFKREVNNFLGANPSALARTL